MVWALNSTNPKRALLLAISLLGNTAISGNLSAEVLVSNTGSGYASKYAGLNSTQSVQSILVGKKLSKNSVNASVLVDSSLSFKKVNNGSLFNAVTVNSYFEFTRPNYHFSSFSSGISVDPEFTFIPRRKSDLVNGVFVYHVASGYKLTGNYFTNSAHVSPYATGIIRYKSNYTSSVIVLADLNTITKLIYADSACVTSNIYSPWVMTAMINCQCACKILLGQSVKLDCSIKDCDSTPITPAELALTVVLPSGQRVVMGLGDLVVEEGVGNYSYSFVPEDEGIYLVQWLSSGNYFGVVESTFQVNKGMV